MVKLQPMPKGGKRPGAGAKLKDPSGEKRTLRRFFITPSEYRAVKSFIDELRKQAKEAKVQESYD